MDEQQTPSPEPEPSAAAPPSAAPPDWTPAPFAGGPVAPGAGPVGKVRSTGTCILLMVVTLGIYGLFWYFYTHDEMKRHSGEGLGGLVALLLAIFVGVVMPFFSSHEVGRMYERRGWQPPVSALTGLWALLLGWFFFVGMFVWFVKTNGALNAYWRSLGAR